jgi:hypothetical protein
MIKLLIICSYRTKLQREKNGTNAQIEFFNQNKAFTSKHRKDPWVDVAIGWNRKKESLVNMNRNTFSNIFNA